MSRSSSSPLGFFLLLQTDSFFHPPMQEMRSRHPIANRGFKGEGRRLILMR